jgi:hypothetical protein
LLPAGFGSDWAPVGVAAGVEAAVDGGGDSEAPATDGSSGVDQNESRASAICRRADATC